MWDLKGSKEVRYVSDDIEKVEIPLFNEIFYNEKRQRILELEDEIGKITGECEKIMDELFSYLYDGLRLTLKTKSNIINLQNDDKWTRYTGRLVFSRDRVGFQYYKRGWIKTISLNDADDRRLILRHSSTIMNSVKSEYADIFADVIKLLRSIDKFDFKDRFRIVSKPFLLQKREPMTGDYDKLVIVVDVKFKCVNVALSSFGRANDLWGLEDLNFSYFYDALIISQKYDTVIELLEEAKSKAKKILSDLQSLIKSKEFENIKNFVDLYSAVKNL